jgi:Integrase core domain
VPKLGLTLSACGTPISVERRDACTVETELTSNALTTGRLSESTQIVLRRLDLLGVYNEDRPAAIRSLSIIRWPRWPSCKRKAPTTAPISLRRSFIPTRFCSPPRLRTAPIRSTRACGRPQDGKGAWRDNVFVERLWRSVKHEEVYLRAYETVAEARRLIGWYLDFFNSKRPHSSLGARTPDDAYFNPLTPLPIAA